MFKGNEAATDGRTILLPALPPGTWLSQVQSKVFMGYLDHEIGHVLLTDSERYSQEVMRRKSGLFAYVLNVIEDIREELAYIEQYPGAKDDLDTLCQYLEGKLVEKVQSMPQDVLSKEILALFYEECWSYRGRPKLMPAELKAHPLGGKEIVEVLKGIPSLKSTEDTVKLAVKACSYLKKWDEQRAEQQAKTPGSGNWKSMSMGGDKPGNPKSGEKGLKITSQSGGTPVSLGNLDDVAQALLLALDKQGFIKEFIGAVMEQVGNKPDKDMRSNSRYKMAGSVVLPPWLPERDTIFVQEAKDRAAFNKVRSGLQPEILTLKNALRVYLQSRSKRGWNRGLEEGELDDDMLWQVPVGATDRLYKELRVSTTFDTALVLLIDQSSSMNDILVKKTAVIMMETSSFLPKVATLVAGFYADAQGAGADGGYSGYGRLQKMHIPLYKGFNETYREARDRVGSITTDGYTPLGEAYAWGLEALLQRTEEKRVLWLVTDGEPFFHRGDRNHSDFILMAQTHARCKRWGIKTVGLELGTKILELSSYVDKSVKIPNASELPAAVLSLARQLLGRTHA